MYKQIQKYLLTLHKKIKLRNRFGKYKPFIIRCNASYYHESRRQTEQTQESKRDNKQPVGKQHADNQSKEYISRSGEKGEKGEESGRGKSKIKQMLF